MCIRDRLVVWYHGIFMRFLFGTKQTSGSAHDLSLFLAHNSQQAKPPDYGLRWSLVLTSGDRLMYVNGPTTYSRTRFILVYLVIELKYYLKGEAVSA